MGSLPEKNIKITFLTDAPFIVKFRFEKYRYLLTYLLCIQIFEAPLSHSHSTGPQNVSAAFNCHCSSECVKRLVPLSVACLVWWHSFRPQIYDESETDQILNAKYFVWKNYTLGKWGSRKAFNQNSLMQLFNGDRPIVHCTMRRSPLQSVNRTIYQNVYLAPHFFPAPLFQMTNIWRKYLITFTFIVYLTTWVMNNHSHNKIQ